MTFIERAGSNPLYDWDALVDEERAHRLIYVDPEIFKLEMTHIFGGTWTYVAHESEIAKPNDFITRKLGLRPIIIVRDGEAPQTTPHAPLPYPIDSARDLLRWCDQIGGSVADVVRANERAWRPEAETAAGLDRIWDAMRRCLHRGCHTPGQLPGGLQVKRRAP